MATVKTAISLDKRLFEAAEHEARRRGMTRSGFIAWALRKAIREAEDERWIKQMSEALAQLTEEEWEEELAFIRGVTAREIQLAKEAGEL